MSRHTLWILCAWSLLLLAATASAQSPPPPKSAAEVDQQAIQALLGFARSAEAAKSPARARVAYRTIVDAYDSDNATARAALGWKKVKGEWQLAVPTDKLPPDAATAAQTKLVDDAWRTASARVAALHKAFGLALDASDHAGAVPHLERALLFAPDDAECHRALGHEDLDGFFGTAAQIAFVKRYRAILAKAREIAALPIQVEAVSADQLPAELKATGFAFAGARCKHATWWVVGTTAEAENCGVWNERAVLMLQYVYGDEPWAKRQLNPDPMKWVAVLRTDEQRARLLEVSPAARGGQTLERALRFSSYYFASESGQAQWMRHKGNDGDYAVGFATKFGESRFNQGLSEGVVHMMTWLLCGTMESSYMAIPATAAGKEVRSTRPADWLRELRAEIDKGEDWPLVDVPREKLENFRDPVRFKSWSFMGWLLARHPDRWVRLMVELGQPRTQEEVTAACQKALGRNLGEVEAEWREWARAGSRIGKASGLPQ